MWEMLEDLIKCDTCGGVLGGPPKFTVPPPPRPPYFSEYSLTICRDAEQAWDSNMCEDIPFPDASRSSNHLWKISVIILILTLIIVAILVALLFAWKRKRKLQNFLALKKPCQGAYINGALPLSSIAELSYEDSHIHLEHHLPLVKAYNHYIRKTCDSNIISYPTGYPMTRSPPYLISSSYEPDQNHSNDNIYEEVDLRPDLCRENYPTLHSDDHFAEDELSLPEEKRVKTDTKTIGSASAKYYERFSALNSLNAPFAKGSVSCQLTNTSNTRKKKHKGRCNKHKIGVEAMSCATDAFEMDFFQKYNFVSSFERHQLQQKTKITTNNYSSHLSTIPSTQSRYSINSKRSSLKNIYQQKISSPTKIGENLFSNLTLERRRCGVASTCVPVVSCRGFSEPQSHGSFIASVNSCEIKNSDSVFLDHHDHCPKKETRTTRSQAASQLYLCEYHSFESDSGYSHYTPSSSIGRNNYEKNNFGSFNVKNITVKNEYEKGIKQEENQIHSNSSKVSSPNNSGNSATTSIFEI